MVIIEYYFNWLTTLDPIMAGGILIATFLLIFVSLIIFIRAISTAIESSRKKKTPVSIILGLFGKKVDNTAEGASELEEEVVEAKRSTDVDEVVVLIIKLLKFKDKQNSTDRDWVANSMKTVETMMKVEFPKSLKKVIYDSNADFYQKNPEILKLISEAIIDTIKEEFKSAIKTNHLHRYTNPMLKKEYISLASQRLTTEVSSQMCTVLNSVREDKGCLDSDIPVDVMYSITNLFDSIFSKLIDLAIMREMEKIKITNELIEELEGGDDLSSSTVSILKGVMNIEFVELTN